MNTRFILPASVAATVHVALLWFLPVEPYTPPDKTTLVEVPLPPVPKSPEDVVTPPSEKSDDPALVKTLPPQAARPELPDEIVSRKSDMPPVTLEHWPISPIKGATTIATESGIDGPGGPGGPIGVPILNATDLDRQPNAKVQIAPEYPPGLKHEGTFGSVLVEFDVDRTGQVSGARVVRSSRREFEEPTLRAVRKWRFEPGRRNGVAVPFRMVVPVEFSLEN